MELHFINTRGKKEESACKGLAAVDMKIQIQKLSTLISGCRHLKMPTLPSSVQCRYDDMCMGLECCLNVDYKLMKKPMKVWSVVDSCFNHVSAGLETFQYNVTLDQTFWGRENLLEISEFVRAL